MTDAVVAYAQQHPEVDLLHFWLADGANNQCECEQCAPTRPSDFYIMMLNDIDRALKQRLWQKEAELHPVLDVYLFTRVYDGIFSTDWKTT